MADIEGLLSKETAGLPNWAWGVVIVAGIGVTYFLPRFFGKSGNTSQTSTDQGTAGSGIGLAIDPTTGLPYAVEGIVPGGGTTGTGSTPGQPTQTFIEELGSIRDRYASSDPNIKNWDKGHPGGVPIRKSPGGQVIGYEGYGDKVLIAGASVSGPSNTGGAGGSTVWYPVQLANGTQGYISAFDFNGTPTPSPITWPNS